MPERAVSRDLSLAVVNRDLSYQAICELLDSEKAISVSPVSKHISLGDQVPFDLQVDTYYSCESQKTLSHFLIMSLFCLSDQKQVPGLIMELVSNEITGLSNPIVIVGNYENLTHRMVEAPYKVHNALPLMQQIDDLYCQAVKENYRQTVQRQMHSTNQKVITSAEANGFAALGMDSSDDQILIKYYE